MKQKKQIPFNLMKIQLEITSKTNKNIEGNERKKIRNERGLMEQMKK